MRIAYCTNVRLPSERAHGHQIAQVCDALVQLGHHVTVFAPYRRNPVQEDFYGYYGVSPAIRLEHLGSFDPINRWWLPGGIGLWMMNALLRTAYVRILRRDAFDLIYTRTPALLPSLLSAGIPVVLELHSIPRLGRSMLLRYVHHCRLVVCLTTPMRDELIALGANPTQLIVAGDAVNPSLLTSAITRSEARQRWGLDSDTFVIGYAGQLASMGHSKGLPELLESCTILFQRNLSFCLLIAGGPASMITSFKKSLDEALRPFVRFLGVLKREDIPYVLQSCDVLVYPAPKSHHPYYQRDTSPLKLFEYMASGVPIACADLPPLRDIVDESVVRFCTPGDPQSLAQAIDWVHEHPEEAKKMAVRAKGLVATQTWDLRMKRIMDTITNDT